MVQPNNIIVSYQLYAKSSILNYKPQIHAIMKRTIIMTLLIILSFTSVFAQHRRVSGNKPGMKFNPEPGYIMINEFTGGIGLGVTSDDYSKYFAGFTTIHGYQVNRDFLVAAGTGVSFYNGGTLIPLFLDFRYRIYVSKWTPYIFGDGGFMLDFSQNKDTRLFLNPGFGYSYTASRNLTINLGAGLYTQFANTRASYINFKTGITYKF